MDPREEGDWSRKRGERVSYGSSGRNLGPMAPVRAYSTLQHAHAGDRLDTGAARGGKSRAATVARTPTRRPFPNLLKQQRASVRVCACFRAVRLDSRRLLSELAGADAKPSRLAFFFFAPSYALTLLPRSARSDHTCIVARSHAPPKLGISGPRSFGLL
ncbi:hypothetical protein MRX96_012038 [Rhipicephalus microplus]